MGDFSPVIIGDGGDFSVIRGENDNGSIEDHESNNCKSSGRLFSDSLGDLRVVTRGGSFGKGGVANNVSISSIQNSPRVMRAAVFSNDRPFDSRKSSENLLLRNNVSVGSRSLDPNTWSQIAIPVDLEPFLHPEKLVYPVIDSPK